MKRSQFAGVTFVLTEGRDDCAFFRRHSAPDACKIEFCHGRPNVLAAVAELDQSAFQGVLGIIDADFARLDESSVVGGNIIMTDWHDVEVMIIESPALDNLLLELGDEEQVASFREVRGPVRKTLLDLAAQVGKARWLSHKQGWGLKFDGLPHERFIDEKTLLLDFPAMLAAIRAHQGGGRPPPSAEEMETGIHALAEEAHDVRHLASGHDVVAILSIGLRRVLGSHGNSSDIKAERLERELRLAYDAAFFACTQLSRAMRDWEARNAPFRVLTSHAEKSAG